jgi:hypothetical protein
MIPTSTNILPDQIAVFGIGFSYFRTGTTRADALPPLRCVIMGFSRKWRENQSDWLVNKRNLRCCTADILARTACQLSRTACQLSRTACQLSRTACLACTPCQLSCMACQLSCTACQLSCMPDILACEADISP